MLALADDSDARVRLHVALALGGSDDARSVAALASIARRDGADRWVRAAVFSGVRGRTASFLDAFQASRATADSVAARAAVMQDIGRLYGATESRERCIALIAVISSWRCASDAAGVCPATVVNVPVEVGSGVV